MTMSIGGQRRAVSAISAPEDKLQEITGVQNRLDEAEAELAALSVMARNQGLGFLRSRSRPLLDEMDTLVSRLRHLILDEGPIGTLPNAVREAIRAPRSATRA